MNNFPCTPLQCTKFFEFQIIMSFGDKSILDEHSILTVGRVLCRLRISINFFLFIRMSTLALRLSILKLFWFVDLINLRIFLSIKDVTSSEKKVNIFKPFLMSYFKIKEAKIGKEENMLHR